MPERKGMKRGGRTGQK